MTEQSNDQSSRLQQYQERLEALMGSAWEGIERQAPEVLDKFAATAKNVGQRLEEMANDARQRAAEEAKPESAETSERAPQPPEAPPS